MDFNDILSDELLGETFIDLENRFYSKKYRNLPSVPIETREIFHPDSAMPQGNVRLWVDIIPIQ